MFFYKSQSIGLVEFSMGERAIGGTRLGDASDVNDAE